jgi:hypothetical protein
MYDASLIAPFKSGLSQYYKPFLIGNGAFTELDNVYSWRGFIKKREGSSILSRVAKWAVLTNLTNATPPVVTSIGHGLVTNDGVWLENVIMTNGAIASIVSGLSTVVTVAGAPGISVGQTVIITGTTGVSTTSATIPFNGTPFYVTAVGANTITINVQTTGSAGAGGRVLLGSITNQAFQITKIDANNFSLQVLNSSPAINVPAGGSSVSGDIYLPIVGTRVFIDSAQNEKLIVFTPKNAYEYNTTTKALDDISFNRGGGAIFWGGTKDNFFYTSNYASSLWATNNVFATPDQPVGIRIFNGSLTTGWQDFKPRLLSTATVFLNSALIILPYKGFMVALNTTEGPLVPTPTDVNFFNRARWSQLGTPYYQATPPAQFGFDINAWVTDIVGKGGFTDADTNEKIVSAAIIQDTLIVGFQFSTWRLRFTGNFIQPFIWERINIDYGSEATFSAVSFDQSLLMISRRGIIGATFNDVQRIDLEVPDFVNKFETGLNSEGMNRIQGVRDYQKRLVYWLYADEAANNQSPNKILCYNYEDTTWSTFTQSFTTLGNYKLTNTDNTWQTWLSPWIGDNETWNTPLDQNNTPIIVAGDFQSNVWNIMDGEFSTDNGVNYNFVVTTNIFNPYFEKGKRCKLAYYDLYITNTDDGQITLENYINDDPSDPWLIKTVDTNDDALTTNPVKTVKYIRVFLGQIARNHQITMTLTADQLADPLIGKSDFELQGIITHTREEGRIKQ